MIVWGRVAHPAIEHHLPLVHWAARSSPDTFTPAAVPGIRHAQFGHELFFFAYSVTA